MDKENDQATVLDNDGEVEETFELPDVGEGEEDTTDWKAEALKLREKATAKGIAQRERTKALKQQLAEARKAVEVAVSAKSSSQPANGELDETQLDYLDLKGVSDPRKIEIVQQVMKKTGMTVRQVLKDDYVLSKFSALEQEEAVKNATPGATKRGGNQVTDISAAIARFEKTGELPDDFNLKTQVINSFVQSKDPNKPLWQRK